MTNEQINDFVEAQLSLWPVAKRNYDNLALTRRRTIELGDFKACLQLNPGRVRSTAAAVDKKSISERPCFLCESNRSKEQISLPWLENWEMLVNPYPILPIHFTIPSRRHTPQGNIPYEMASMAEQAPDLVFFFNGAKAGASAPDHMHCQAVLKNELPIVSMAEQHHPTDSRGWKSSEEFGLSIPFQFLSGVIYPDAQGLKDLSKLEKAGGIANGVEAISTELVNAFAWIDKRGFLRLVVIPRRAHRSSHYFRETDNFMVSPGALDMAGLVILPRENDFDRMDAETLKEIYSETAFTELPSKIKSAFI